jgi:hypothetical protein
MMLSKPFFLSVIIFVSLLGISTAGQPLVVHNQGILGNSHNVATLKMYNDSSLTTLANLTELTNNTFSQSDIYGGYGYRWVYGVLTANTTTNVTLNVYTVNWSPPDTANYTMFFCYRNLTDVDVTDLNGSTVQAGPQPTYMQIELTLYTPWNLPTSDYPFFFDIVLNITYVGEP